MRIGGEELHVEGTILEWLDHEPRGNISVSGDIGPGIWGLIGEPLARVTGVNWREPSVARLLSSRLEWGPEGVSLRGHLSWAGEVQLQGDLLVKQGEWRIQELRVQDSNTQATLSLEITPRAWELIMEGRLSGVTLDLFTLENPLGPGWLQGHLRVVGGEGGFSITGEALGEGIPLARYLGGPWSLVRGKFSGRGQELLVERADLVRKDTEVSLWGAGSLSSEGLRLDATLETRAMEVEELGEMASELAGSVGGGVTGSLGLRLGMLRVGDTAMEPFHADLEFEPSGSRLKVRYALVCGVGLSGLLQIRPGPVQWVFHPVAREIPLEEAMACLGLGSAGFTGRVDLEGELTGEGSQPGSLESMRGSLQILLHRGELEGARIWPMILEAVREVEGREAWSQGMAQEGVQVEKGLVAGQLEQGLLTVKEGWLQGPMMVAAGRGDVDFLARELHLEILLEPAGPRPKSAKSRPSPPLVALTVDGDFQDPVVRRVDAARVSKGLLERMGKAQSPEALADRAKGARKVRAK